MSVLYSILWTGVILRTCVNWIEIWDVSLLAYNIAVDTTKVTNHWSAVTQTILGGLILYPFSANFLWYVPSRNRLPCDAVLGEQIVDLFSAKCHTVV